MGTRSALSGSSRRGGRKENRYAGSTDWRGYLAALPGVRVWPSRPPARGRAPSESPLRPRRRVPRPSRPANRVANREEGGRSLDMLVVGIAHFSFFSAVPTRRRSYRCYCRQLVGETITSHPVGLCSYGLYSYGIYTYGLYGHGHSHPIVLVVVIAMVAAARRAGDLQPI